jgi:hypothetical protein
MRKSTKFILAGAVAAGIAAFGASSAFTASNTLPSGPDQNTAGYASVAATGVTVSAIHYVQDANASKVDSVTFDTANDITSVPKSSTLTLSLSGTPVAAPSTCINAAGVAPAPNTITCTFTTPEDIAAFDATALTVTNS